MRFARSVFESALERVRRSYKLCVYGYVVIPEHVHLLLSEPERETLAVAIKSLEQGVSRRLIGGAEHFWQALLRFQYSELSSVCGEAAPLHSPESGEARVV